MNGPGTPRSGVHANTPKRMCVISASCVARSARPTIEGMKKKNKTLQIAGMALLLMAPETVSLVAHVEEREKPHAHYEMQLDAFSEPSPVWATTSGAVPINVAYRANPAWILNSAGKAIRPVRSIWYNF